jgi:hypothetical protein
MFARRKSWPVHLYVLILPQLSSCIPPSLSKLRLKILSSMYLRLALLAGKGGGGKNSFGKRGSTGISNVSNAAVDDCFFDKNEYHSFTPEQKNTLRLKSLKPGHVGNGDDGNGNGNGKGNGKGPTLKSLTRSIAALATRFDKFNLPDDDDDESSEDEEGTSNRSNADLNRQSKNNNNKKKKRGGN